MVVPLGGCGAAGVAVGGGRLVGVRFAGAPGVVVPTRQGCFVVLVWCGGGPAWADSVVRGVSVFHEWAWGDGHGGAGYGHLA